MAGQAALVPDGPGFGQGLGQRLIAMVQQGLQQAQLRIHPEHLGPLEVRLRTEGDAVQVTLTSPHASVREALESALPRLRDTLGEHGLSLAQADVGGGEREAAGRGEGDAESTPGPQAVDGEGESLADSAGDGRLTPRSISLVDTFA
ncbi:MAG: flagellar hook-length control protein FliK [Gammaproteobacteria bacterium]|nr:flagellar hook-length control protein FliK [Gammaproteobacteria bacterium]